MVLDDELKVLFDRKSQGKVRFKQINDYGIGEQIKQDEISLKNPRQYVEWQITYNIRADSKDKDFVWLVDIDKCVYKDAKGNERQLYELSKILYEIKNKGWIKKEYIKQLLDEIKSYTIFLDSIETYVVENEGESSKKVNGLEFRFYRWIIPLFRFYNRDGTFIETLKEKQQYAYHMQMMVYFCIPCSILEEQKTNLVYKITPQNMDSIINTVKVFGCASKRHQHDVLKILECFLNM